MKSLYFRCPMADTCQHQHRHQILTQEDWATVRFQFRCDPCAAAFRAGEAEEVAR